MGMMEGLARLRSGRDYIFCSWVQGKHTAISQRDDSHGVIVTHSALCTYRRTHLPYIGFCVVVYVRVVVLLFVGLVICSRTWTSRFRRGFLSRTLTYIW